MALDLANIKSIVGLSGLTVKEVQCKSNNKVVWKAGAIVTYVVDTTIAYTEEVDMGASCLAPTTFTPAKDGWTFVGWRKDGVASGTVETNVVMGGEPITLYAVYQKTITENFTSHDGTKLVNYPVQSTAYYNASGSTKYSDITAPSAAGWPGMVFQGWSYPNDGASMNINVYAGSSWTSTGDCVRYAIYHATAYLYYYITGVQHYTPGTIMVNVAGTWVYPTIAIPDPVISGATFNGWSVTAGSTAVSYGSLANGIQITTNTTVYAVVTYSNITLKSGSTSYSRESGTDINVLTGIDGSKYSAINIGVGSTWVETGRWATVCSARAILRVKTSSGTTYADTILHEMCWEDGYWSGEPYEQGAHIQNTTVAMNLYPGNVGQMLAVVFDGDAVGGNVYVNTITAIGKTIVG